MSFGRVLLAILCPPAYFLVRGRLGATLINTFFYLVAATFCITVFLLPVGMLMWLLCVAHAMCDVYTVRRDAEMRRQAELIGHELGSRTAGMPTR